MSIFKMFFFYQNCDCICPKSITSLRISIDNREHIWEKGPIGNFSRHEI